MKEGACVPASTAEAATTGTTTSPPDDLLSPLTVVAPAVVFVATAGLCAGKVVALLLGTSVVPPAPSVRVGSAITPEFFFAGAATLLVVDAVLLGAAARGWSDVVADTVVVGAAGLGGCAVVAVRSAVAAVPATVPAAVASAVVSTAVELNNLGELELRESVCVVSGTVACAAVDSDSVVVRWSQRLHVLKQAAWVAGSAHAPGCILATRHMGVSFAPRFGHGRAGFVGLGVEVTAVVVVAVAVVVAPHLPQDMAHKTGTLNVDLLQNISRVEQFTAGLSAHAGACVVSLLADAVVVACVAARWSQRLHVLKQTLAVSLSAHSIGLIWAARHAGLSFALRSGHGYATVVVAAAAAIVVGSVEQQQEGRLGQDASMKLDRLLIRLLKKKSQ